MGSIDPSILHAEHIARLLKPEQRLALGVQTAAEAGEKALAGEERKLQGDIANYLRLHGIWFDCDAMHAKRRGTLGTPDFLLCYRKVAIGIEAKTVAGSLSGAQILAHAAMLNNGWRVIVARSMADVQSLFRTIDAEIDTQ